MARTFISLATLLTLALGSGIGMAEPGASVAAEPNTDALLACQKIAESSQRLACFDAESAKLGAALSRKDVVVVSRNEVKAAQKSVFGLSLPRLGIFGGTQEASKAEANEEEGVGYIDAHIESARQGPDGKWIFVLDDGARWAQSDTSNIRLPKSGDTMRIRRAALGSYMANINGRPAIRVRRLS